jgi:ribonuclease BN (tRNA processing enzyme)
VVPACCYIITCEKGALMVSGDTYMHPIVADRIASESGLNALVLEVSFPNRLDEIARQSKHLTPKLVAELLEGLPRQDIRIYFYHMKPDYKVEIAVELAQTLNRHYDWVLLDDGDTVPYCFS